MPGPASYDIERSTQSMSSTAKHVGPKFTFPRQGRIMENKQLIGFPDPASYTPKKHNGAPKIT